MLSVIVLVNLLFASFVPDILGRRTQERYYRKFGQDRPDSESFPTAQLRNLPNNNIS